MSQLENAGISKINHEELSGIDLQSNPSSFFHQKIRSDTGMHRYSNSLAFPSPALNQDNRIYLPSMPLIPEQLVIEFLMGAASGPTGAAYMPTYWWVAANGVRLLYKNTVVYHCSQAELEADFYLNNDYRELHRKQSISNDLGTRLGSAGLYYLDLQPLMKIFRHIGALNAYDANSWSIEIDIKPETQIVDGTSGSTAGAGSISSANLLVMGHRASAEFAGVIRNKLNTSGLMINFLQSNYQKDSYAAAASSKTVTLNNLEGNASGMVLLHRVVAGYDGVTGTTVADTSQTFNETDSTVSIGRTSNPVEVFGRAVPEKQLRLVFDANKTWNGLPKYVNETGTSTDKSIIPVSFADTHSNDSANGQSSGSIYLKNDFQYIYTWGSATTTANYLETIVFIHRYAIIRSDGVFTNNSY